LEFQNDGRHEYAHDTRHAACTSVDENMFAGRAVSMGGAGGPAGSPKSVVLKGVPAIEIAVTRHTKPAYAGCFPAMS
jgi:hypothetical protein